MSSTLPYFSLDFYKEESTATDNSGVLKTWRECYEEAVYETFLESKRFTKLAERAEKTFLTDPTKFPVLE